MPTKADWNAAEVKNNKANFANEMKELANSFDKTDDFIKTRLESIKRLAGAGLYDTTIFESELINVNKKIVFDVLKEHGLKITNKWFKRYWIISWD